MTMCTYQLDIRKQMGSHLYSITKGKTIKRQIVYLKEKNYQPKEGRKFKGIKLLVDFKERVVRGAQSEQRELYASIKANNLSQLQ